MSGERQGILKKALIRLAGKEVRFPSHGALLGGADAGRRRTRTTSVPDGRLGPRQRRPPARAPAVLAGVLQTALNLFRVSSSHTLPLCLSRHSPLPHSFFLLGGGVFTKWEREISASARESQSSS